jgi:hypothetical protein
MKRPSTPKGDGLGSERQKRVAGERSHKRSDNRRASPPSNSSPSPSKPTASGNLPSTALTVVLRARGRSRFDALLEGVQIVKASRNPISDAARILHRHGYSDDCLLIARHEGAKHDAMHGPLGKWRKTESAKTAGCAMSPPKKAVARSRESNIGLIRKTRPRRRPAQPRAICGPAAACATTS